MSIFHHIAITLRENIPVLYRSTLMRFLKFVLLILSLIQALFMAFEPHAETFLVTHTGLESFSLCPLLRGSEVVFPAHQMGPVVPHIRVFKHKASAFPPFSYLFRCLAPS